MAGVECEHDLVVALDAEFLGHQLAVPGRMLPVDEAAVEARDHVVAGSASNSVPCALLLLHAAVAEQRPRAKNCAAPSCACTRRVRHHVDHAVDARRAATELDQAERRAPAAPDRVDAHPCCRAAAPATGKRGLRGPAGHALHADDFVGVGIEATARTTSSNSELKTAAAQPGAIVTAEQPVLADLQARRHVSGHLQAARAGTRSARSTARSRSAPARRSRTTTATAPDRRWRAAARAAAAPAAKIVNARSVGWIIAAPPCGRGSR